MQTKNYIITDEDPGLRIENNNKYRGGSIKSSH